MPADDLTRSVQRLLRQVGHWGQSRWSSPPPSAAGEAAPTRADVVHALVQRLADLGADAESRPHRPVPRPGDLVLPDQLRVMADDLVRAADDVRIRRAVEEVDSVRHAL